MNETRLIDELQRTMQTAVNTRCEHLPATQHGSRGAALRRLSTALLATGMLVSALQAAAPPMPQIALPAPQAAPAIVEQPPPQVNQILDLPQSVIVTLDVDTRAIVPAAVDVPFEGVWHTLKLAPHSVRSEQYRLLVQDESGELTSVEPGPIGTFRGTVVGIPGSVVVGGMVNGGLNALIQIPDVGDYGIEPAADVVEGAQPSDYVVYRQNDVLLGEFACRVDDSTSAAAVIDFASSGGGSGGTQMATGSRIMHIAELGIDSEFEFFRRMGSVAAAEARINSIINVNNIQFERDVQISLSITGLIVRAAEPDPYPTTGGMLFHTILRNELNLAGVPHDIGELFRHRPGWGGQAARAAAICSEFGYCYVNTEQIWLHLPVGFTTATNLSAHELGHVAGANHCICPTTMNTPVNSNNRFDPVRTIPDIVSHRDSVTCLDIVDLGIEAPPVATIVETGTLTGGTVAELDASDETHVTMTSGTVGSKEVTDLTVHFISPLATVSQMTVSIETGVDDAGIGSRTFVYLFDFERARWDRIDRFDQPVPDTRMAFPVVRNPSAYVDGAGNIRVRVLTKRGRGSAFRTRIDHVDVGVWP